MRQATYRLLGLLFRYPSEEVTRPALALAAELEPESDLLHSFPFHDGWRALLGDVLRLTAETPGQLEEEYLDLFLLRGPCPLHEAGYADAGVSGWAAVAAEVERTYAASGVALVPEATDELPDHAGFELEFLSLLCAEEALAWRDGLSAHALDCLAREAEFLDRHLGQWLPALASRIRLAARPESFYRRLAEAAHGFVVHDRDLIRGLVEGPG